MHKKGILGAWAIVVLSIVFSSFCYAERPKNAQGEVASELQLEQMDFNYKAYKQNLAHIKEVLSGNGSVSDSLLQLEGFGLISHDAALRLKLEVAESRGESAEKIKKLEQELMDTRKEIEAFLSKTKSPVARAGLKL